MELKILLELKWALISPYNWATYENWTEVMFVSVYLVMPLSSVPRWIRSPLVKSTYDLSLELVLFSLLVMMYDDELCMLHDGWLSVYTELSCELLLIKCWHCWNNLPWEWQQCMRCISFYIHALAHSCSERLKRKKTHFKRFYSLSVFTSFWTFCFFSATNKSPILYYCIHLRWQQHP